MPVDPAAAAGVTSNPDRAEAALRRLVERNPQTMDRLGEEGIARLAVVAAVSGPLVDGVARHDRMAAVLTGSLEERPAGRVADDCRSALTGAENPAAVLAVEQRAGLLHIALRDLLGIASTPQIAVELADLAQGILAAATEHVTAHTGGRLAVVAMGKLGGRELNYVSDVDVIFVGSDDEWSASTRAAERFMRLMATVTPAGRAYEVDANLRPEGKDGSLVRSIQAYRSYYQRWAKTWEFQALLKARPLAGDAQLGSSFAELIEPFVWPDRLHEQAVEEIQQLKGVVESSAPVRRAGPRQVKLAPGGLRDIEFAVQLLQLVHGRHDRSLRSPNTLEALDALASGGYVGYADAADFRHAYVFLRTVEHRLQLANLRRTHTLPHGDDERRRLARTVAAHLPEPRAEGEHADLLQRFDTELARVQGEVRRLHEKLFYRPLLERFAQLSSAEQLPVGADEERGLAADAAQERLTALGFARPQVALGHLDALAGGVSRRARLFRTALPAMLPTLASAPDPDEGLAALRSLADSTKESPQLLRALRDHPPVADMLARVLGSSRVVGRWLERQPEVLALLVDDQGLQRRRNADDYLRLADGLRRRRQVGNEEGAALRRMRRREAARIAFRDLAGLADVIDVATELSGLAQACLQAALDSVVPDGVTMAVIGMGKLGGSELGYASDLDVLLVAEPGDALAAAEQAAERFLELLSAITPEGQAFRVDLNLRPEGKQGPLVRTLSSYRNYYERWGETWELQALTQARHVAGDRALGRSFVATMADLVYPPSPPAKRLTDIRTMKARVERERAGDRPQRTGPRRRMAPTGRLGGTPEGSPPRRRTRIDLKLGPGGMADVEWTVQLLQLRHGGRRPAVRRPGALAGAAACVDAGVLSSQDGQWLQNGWRLLAAVRNMRYLTGTHDTHVLPSNPREMERLARMLGYPRPGGQALAEEVARAMRRVRKVHERCFYDAATP
ncbi:MAG: bifunctional [glutamine synthetase] adenylyltransferase/[glutamine synthetase]-adenylyl-L-tyrosine phosphorylase [Nitriliruptorales bacterium]|nr:bifunctional [glutamine synthetase] adenylyltransferase/[glutamine synthetase]-adenylyl-L-tyrosine phosphorylase [Nitriliruptorales bacterium]